MLRKEDVIKSIEILEDGQIQLKRAIRVYDDAELISETLHRSVVSPGQDVSRFAHQRLTDVSRVVWTADVVKTFTDTQAAIAADLEAKKRLPPNVRS